MDDIDLLMVVALQQTQVIGYVDFVECHSIHLRKIYDTVISNTNVGNFGE